jgi:hypothetical protein
VAPVRGALRRRRRADCNRVIRMLGCIKRPERACRPSPIPAKGAQEHLTECLDDDPEAHLRDSARAIAGGWGPRTPALRPEWRGRSRTIWKPKPAVWSPDRSRRFEHVTPEALEAPGEVPHRHTQDGSYLPAARAAEKAATQPPIGHPTRRSRTASRLPVSTRTIGASESSERASERSERRLSSRGRSRTGRKCP